MTLQQNDNDRLQRLRQWRNVHANKDLSLSFLNKLFNRDIERPYRQMQTVIDLWTQLLPPELAEHTRLESFRRGVLKVAVDSSSRLYELDRLLRNGLEQQLIQAHHGPALRKIKLFVANMQHDAK